MNRGIIVIAAFLIVLGAGIAAAVPGTFWNSMMNTGNNMMNTGNSMMNSGDGMHGGMMGWLGGMMDDGRGMMGNGMHCGYANGNSVNGAPITIEQAGEAVEQYLGPTGNSDLTLAEVMEFNNHFYAEVEEKSTGVHAFELLVNKYTGAVSPEPGPNMMWNTRYGHMNSGNEGQATVTGEQAIKNAQAYLDRTLPGTKASEADEFYGYYTLHVLKQDKIYGMLSVNSYTGAVWYHSWHGEFVKILKAD